MVSSQSPENETRPAPAARPTGALAPFHYPAFRAIWLANLASNLGSAIQSVGAAWLMTELTDSHVMIALVQASVTVPILMLGIFAGAIADNFDRRRVMLAAQTGMLATSALLAATTWMGLINPLMLLAFTLLVGSGTALNGPAWQASVRQQVGLAVLPQAISLNTISFNLARSVGPALGGALLSLGTPALAFALNSASFIAMIVVLLRWHPETAKRTRRPMLPAIATGIRFCASSSPIRRILLRGMTIGFGVGGFQALIPSVVRDRLHGSELDFGFMLGLFGIGSIISAVMIAPARRRWGTENVLAFATLLFIAAHLGMAAARTILQALPLTFLAGMGWVAALTSINVAMQLRSPEAILGRCLSIYQAVTFGAMAVGAWVWGTFADWRGLSAALSAPAAFLGASLLLRVIAPMPRPHEGRVES